MTILFRRINCANVLDRWSTEINLCKSQSHFNRFRTRFWSTLPCNLFYLLTSFDLYMLIFLFGKSMDQQPHYTFFTPSRNEVTFYFQGLSLDMISWLASSPRRLKVMINPQQLKFPTSETAKTSKCITV